MDLGGSWTFYVSGCVGSTDPTANRSSVPVVRKQLVVAATVHFCERCVALAVIAQQINWDML